MSDKLLSGGLKYMENVRRILDQIASTQGGAIADAADAVVQTVRDDGIIYLFGTGHSHMLAEEGHFRAGGFAPVCPVLPSGLMLHESATGSSRYERLPGLAEVVLARYPLAPRDVLFVFSNSGVNAVPVEAALYGKQMGLTVIAVVALDYASQAPLSTVGKRLSEVADIVIDNQGPPGDAVVEIADTGIRGGAMSTVAGAYILNAILMEAAERLATVSDEPLPVFVSSNMPNAKEHNRDLLDRYSSRNPHL